MKYKFVLVKKSTGQYIWAEVPDGLNSNSKSNPYPFSSEILNPNPIHIQSIIHNPYSIHNP